MLHYIINIHFNVRYEISMITVKLHPLLSEFPCSIPSLHQFVPTDGWSQTLRTLCSPPPDSLTCSCRHDKQILLAEASDP